MARGGAGMKPNGGYALADLRYRPIEHILEALNAKQLGAALEINKDTAAQIASDPGRFVDTPFELTDAQDGKIRAWLEGRS